MSNVILDKLLDLSGKGFQVIFKPGTRYEMDIVMIKEIWKGEEVTCIHSVSRREFSHSPSAANMIVETLKTMEDTIDNEIQTRKDRKAGG